MALSPPDHETDPSIAHCQSCSRPMASADDRGTLEDGSASREYCGCCLARGAWVEPGVSQRDLIERCVDVWVESGHGAEAEVRAYFEEVFPTLKRWRGRAA